MMNPHPILPGEEKIMAPTLEEALEPFAGIFECGCTFGPGDLEGDNDDRNWFQHDGCILTVGHFRRAAQALAAHREREGRDFDADLSSAKRADHDGERSPGDEATIWRVCRAIRGECLECPASEVMGGDDCVRSCRLQATECLNVVETGNPWRKTSDVNPPWTTLSGPQSNEGTDYPTNLSRASSSPRQHSEGEVRGGYVPDPNSPLEQLCALARDDEETRF